MSFETKLADSPTTEQKIERLGELADKLDELERLKRELKIHAYEIGKLRAQHDREDRLKRILLLFFAGFCYGILSLTILES